MDECTKLAQLPATYYDDMPFTKYRANKIIRSTGCRKKQFTKDTNGGSADDKFKKFLKAEHARSFFPMILLQCKENPELRIFLTNEILKITAELKEGI